MKSFQKTFSPFLLGQHSIIQILQIERMDFRPLPETRAFSLCACPLREAPCSFLAKKLRVESYLRLHALENGSNL
jgi:hypothetical protein